MSRGSPAAGALEAPAQLVYHGKPPAAGTVRYVRFGRAQRIGRAVRAFLTCWGLAVVSVFVPLGHFFLVPGFFIAGPVLGLMRWNEEASARGARGACPACGMEQEFDARGRLGPHHAIRCDGCHRQLDLIADLPASGG